MTRTRITLLLCVAIAFQVLVLVGMVAKAALPLWTGTEIRVATVPVDPRSMFRGNYARLDYDFGRLPADAFIDVQRRRAGEVVYVSLARGETGKYEFAAASLEKPAEGIFLRGRVTNVGDLIRIRYGIEAFFAPKELALKLEGDLRDGGTAVLMVSSNGRAALKDVLP